MNEYDQIQTFGRHIDELREENERLAKYERLFNRLYDVANSLPMSVQEFAGWDNDDLDWVAYQKEKGWYEEDAE